MIPFFYICIYMIYILLSTLFFGFSDVLWKLILKKYNYNSAVLSRTIISSTLLIIFAFLFGNSTLASGYNYLLIILFGSVSAFAFMFLIKALEISAISVVITLNSVTLIVTQITSFLFFDDPINWIRYSLVFILILTAIFLLNKAEFVLSKGIKYALCSSVLFGISYPLLSIPVLEVGNFQTAAIQEITLLFWVILYGYKNRKVTKLNLHFSFRIIGLALFAAFGVSLLFYAYSFMEVYKVHMIASFSPVPALLIAIIVLKERVTKIQIVGILLSICATYLIVTNFI